MKKIILSIFALGALAVNAQEVTGFSKGNIALTTGFNYGSTTTGTTKTTDIGFTPMGMYMIQNNWGIRGGLSFTSKKVETGGVSTKTDVFGLNAGARYFFTPSNRLSFYLDGGVDASFPTNVTNFGVNFNPGVNYFIHKNWAVGANFNLMRFDVSAPSGGDANVNFNINPVTNLGGLNFTLMYVIK